MQVPGTSGAADNERIRLRRSPVSKIEGYDSKKLSGQTESIGLGYKYLLGSSPSFDSSFK